MCYNFSQSYILSANFQIKIFFYKSLLVSELLCTFAKQNDKTMPQTFEQMQFSNEVNQGQEFDSTDHSRVDQYNPYNYDCGSYEHKYSHLAPETHDEADY